jgi:hypothetical protein
MVWFDMAAAFPAIQLSSHYSLTALGAFTTAFLLGSGIFQVPAGVFSARYGATRSTLIGLFLVTLFRLRPLLAMATLTSFLCALQRV